MIYDTKAIKKADREVARAAQRCKDLSQAVFSMDAELAEKSRIEALGACNRAVEQLEKCQVEERPPRYEKNTNVLKAEFSYDEKLNIFRCRIPGRIPHRPKSNGTRMVFDYDVSAYKDAMIRTFNSFFYNNKIPKFDKRVDICITSHYKDIRYMSDYDNLDYKPLIDAVSRSVLIDDSPMFTRLICDAIWDDEEDDYVEVEVKAENRDNTV